MVCLFFLDTFSVESAKRAGSDLRWTVSIIPARSSRFYRGPVATHIRADSVVAAPH